MASGRRRPPEELRKAIGSLRGQLIWQFFGESLVVVLVSFCVGLGLTMASLGWFNQLAAKQLDIPWANPWFWVVSTVFIIITGIIAGSYPALYLSSFNPVKALKGVARLGQASVIPRKMLVVFQFTISVALINCTIIILRQVQHAKDRPVGYIRESQLDSSGMVINESAMKEMGLKDPIGTEVTWTWWMDRSQVLRYKIIGVIKDMVIESPYSPTGPVVYYEKGLNGGVSWIDIKIKPNVAMSQALPKTEAVMKKLIPSAPFDYRFVDEDYALKFASEVRMSKLAGFFAALAIFISCLGLFGLASFTAEQRTKVIGIRKVLGASVFTLWRLLSKEFVLLVTISFLIAVPVAYYFMYHWLMQYQYKIGISGWIFAASGIGALVISLVTVSLQAVKAAVANPVRSLKTE